MLDRPIIFSGEMTRALLDGRKTMTRRVLKPQPDASREFVGIYGPGLSAVFEDTCPINTRGDLSIRLPFTPNNKLWVREAWHPVIEGHPVFLYRADNEIVYHDTGTRDKNVIYEQPTRWRPSIHMPRWASRLTLIVTDVRVERLQDISEEDAKAEGLESVVGDGPGPGAGYKWDGVGYHGGNIRKRWGKTYHTPRRDELPGCSCHVGGPSPAQCAFRELWDRLYKPGSQWQDNPWVCVVRFETHKANIDAMKEAA